MKYERMISFITSELEKYFLNMITFLNHKGNKTAFL